MIPTVIYRNGFDAKKCLKDVDKQGWASFFCKVGQWTFFGAGAIHGKTEDFKGKREEELKAFEKDMKDSKIFLVQPYMLKPNGEVFDEVRNFFIDGQWRYSVFSMAPMKPMLAIIRNLMGRARKPARLWLSKFTKRS